MIQRRLMVAAVFGAALFATSGVAAPAQARQVEPVLAPVPPVTAADRIMGRADAPVTVIEYASFTCNHCAAWTNDVLPRFKTRYIDTGHVRLVFRNMPTPPAQIAATAAGIARCAAPAKFFDVAHGFMSGQAAALEKDGALNWLMQGIAASGRSQAEIETCLADPATGNRLQAEVEGAVAAGVTGTPTFFVNGKRMADPSLATLAAAIDPLIWAH